MEENETEQLLRNEKKDTERSKNMLKTKKRNKKQEQSRVDDRRGYEGCIS